MRERISENHKSSLGFEILMMGLFLHVYVRSHMLMNCIQNILERGAEIYSSLALFITHTHAHIYIVRERENRLQYDGEYSTAYNLVL